jgi:hypothetical protein
MPKGAASSSPSVFAYIIRTVGPGYQLKGAVPWAAGGRVFFGACKKRMRPNVKPGDYVIGISGSDAGNPRRVLLWMKVDEKLTFKEAYDRGEKDNVFRSLRGTAIHVRPADVPLHLAGDPNCYQHIQGAPHADEWRSDLKGAREVFLTGAKGSWVAEADGPVVTATLVELLRAGITWKGLATLDNPLTENARGKHACLTGRTADQVISLMPQISLQSVSSQHQHSACARKCSCE